MGQDGKPQTIRIPRTRDEVNELLAHRKELLNQLKGVSARRSNLATEIAQTATDAARLGLQDRLRLLDNRILQLEGDLAIIGRQLSSAPSELTSESRQLAANGGDDWADGLMLGAGFTLIFGIIVFFAQRRWGRRHGAGRPQLGNDSNQRLERLEHGLEAIAIEIERVLEGQRFVTKLLSESQGQLSPSGRLAQPAPVKRDDPAPR